MLSPVCRASALRQWRAGLVHRGLRTAHPLPKHCPIPLDSRRLTSTSRESDPNHFEPNFRALVCKAASRLKICPTLLEGFESLPLRNDDYRRFEDLIFCFGRHSHVGVCWVSF